MDDSYLSLPGPSRPTRQPIGLDIDPSIPSTTLPDPADIYHSHTQPQLHRAHQPHSAQQASPPEPDSSFIPYLGAGGRNGAFIDPEEGDEDEGAEEDEEDEDEGEEEQAVAEGEDAASETSSAMYDPEMDPKGFAKRLDELAGTLEMTEEEARAMRQGPAMGKGYRAPLLPLPEFKTYLNRYLTSTEWKYAPPAYATSVLHRQGGQEKYLPGEDYGSLHPIRVLGRSWVGRDVDIDAGSEDEGLLGEGLPKVREEGMVVEGLIR